MPVGLGLGRAAMRARHLSVVRDEETTGCAVPALHLTANSIGVRLLEVADDVDLEIVIDELLGDEIFCRTLRLLNGELDNPKLTTDARLPSIHDVIDAQQSARIDALDPLYERWFQLRKQWLELVDLPGAAVVPDSAQVFIERLYDPAIPPRVAMLQLAAMRGEAALVGLLAAAIRRIAPPAWLAARLVDYVVEGIDSCLRLFASIPELNVPESWVPASDRLPLAELLELNRKAANGAQLLMLMTATQPDQTPVTPWEQLPDEQ